MESIENRTFNAYVVNESITAEGKSQFSGEISQKAVSELPKGELLVNVHYSSLNYKDALSASGNKGVTRQYPHTPGIDAVGTIVNITADSNGNVNSEFSLGDEVIVTSYDLGMNTAGGFAQFIRVPASWAIKLPKTLTMKEAMIYGTAGLTAGMSVLRLSELVKPEDGEIIVSGATGGVGSLSVAILANLGYSVTAITSKASEKAYLLSLGANQVIMRADFEGVDNKPMLKPLYAGAIDTVGGVILENIIKSVLPNGVVTCCGNVASPKLTLTVFPFILRGITLIGIDSQNYPMKYRKAVWEKLATSYKPAELMNNFDEVSLTELPEKIALMLTGALKGRTLINVAQ